MIDLTRYVEAYERLRRTMQGVASCATECGCCRMHQRIAGEALVEAEKILKADKNSATSG